MSTDQGQSYYRAVASNITVTAYWNPPMDTNWFPESYTLFGNTNKTFFQIASTLGETNVSVELPDMVWMFSVMAHCIAGDGTEADTAASIPVSYKQPPLTVNISQP